MRRLAFFGGSFDPVHRGHLAIASSLLELFALDEFLFLPAFHAPHKSDSRPASAYHRFAMLCLATANHPKISVSTLELDHAEKRYTIDTLAEIDRTYPDTKTFFVMGADSWIDIATWRRWEDVLLSSNHIVVSRPGYQIDSVHVTDAVRSRIVDLRSIGTRPMAEADESKIYITDAVRLDVSATEIREDIREDSELDRQDDVPAEVANYIEKYELYR